MAKKSVKKSLFSLNRENKSLLKQDQEEQALEDFGLLPVENLLSGEKSEQSEADLLRRDREEIAEATEEMSQMIMA